MKIETLKTMVGVAAALLILGSVLSIPAAFQYAAFKEKHSMKILTESEYPVMEYKAGE